MEAWVEVVTMQLERKYMNLIYVLKVKLIEIDDGLDVDWFEQLMNEGTSYTKTGRTEGARLARQTVRIQFEAC